MKRLLVWLAALALLATAQGALVHVHANEIEAAAVRFAALPWGLTPPPQRCAQACSILHSSRWMEMH